MKRAVLLGLGGLALLAIGGFAGWRLHRPGADARAYAEMRLIAVQVSLDEAPPELRDAYEKATHLSGGKQVININGKTYGSIEELPPEVRLQYEQLMKMVNGTTNGITTEPKQGAAFSFKIGRSPYEEPEGPTPVTSTKGFLVFGLTIILLGLIYWAAHL